MFSFIAELFGKSRDVRALDRQLHISGINPRAVNDATKFTICKWIQEATAASGQSDGPEAASRRQETLRTEAAELLAYCILGSSDFEEANSAALADRLEQRLAAAIEDESGFDAGIIMLTLHAGIAGPELAARVELEEDA